MQQVVVGSENNTKLDAVAAVFSQASIQPVSVSSNVSSQPIGDEETLTGAVHRARNAQKIYPQALSIGLEGGVMRVAGHLYLNNWGALITPQGTVYTAAGARIRLPDSFTMQIESGEELSDIMNAYTKRQAIRHHEGAIGVFTQNEVDRTSLFIQIVRMLYGQMNYWQNKAYK